MDEKQISEEELGTYEAKSGGVSAKVTITARILNNEIIGGGFTRHGGSGSDYYFSDISFRQENCDLRRFVQYGGQVNFNLGCSYIGGIFEMIRENADSIADLLNPRNSKYTKWDVVKCAFSLEEQTKQLYKQRSKAKEERQQMPPTT